MAATHTTTRPPSCTAAASDSARCPPGNRARAVQVVAAVRPWPRRQVQVAAFFYGYFFIFNPFPIYLFFRCEHPPEMREDERLFIYERYTHLRQKSVQTCRLSTYNNSVIVFQHAIAPTRKVHRINGNFVQGRRDDSPPGAATDGRAIWGIGRGCWPTEVGARAGGCVVRGERTRAGYAPLCPGAPASLRVLWCWLTGVCLVRRTSVDHCWRLSGCVG